MIRTPDIFDRRELLSAMPKRLLALVFSVALLAPLAAETARTSEINAALRQEEGARSEIMHTMHFLTDVYGPRLTGSPRAKAAAEWAVKTMTGWGFENGHLEPWEFGHPGWENEHVTAHVIAPVKSQLTVEVLAWSPGTRGTVTAAAFQLAPPDRPTSSDLDRYFESVRTQIKGKIVLSSRPVAVPPRLEARPTRADDARLRTLYDPTREPSQGRGRGEQAAAPPMTRAEISRRIDEFLVLNGAALRVNDAGRELGQIAAFNNPTYDVARVVPTVVMRNEDYGRIARILADGTPVTLEFNIVNTSYPDGHTAFNAIAEIPGSDKRDQVVMLGGHLDSWHNATGATDNAIGCAAMMEAARLLKAIGVRPRRTIRVALWSGEEHGLLGSQAYVRQHFGAIEDPKREHFLLSAYLNLDTGTGRIRGANVFGPPAAADVLRSTLAPFADLGVVGVAASNRRSLGGTDSTTFNAAGLPGINFDQDPIQYDAATHHTNLDTYERIVEDDVRAAAVVIAATAYELAMRDDLLPRFDKANMPSGSWR
jgi:carboxypeptidase Q